jgi:DNA invertase Pin-like site-specific DNA recombinase
MFERPDKGKLRLRCAIYTRKSSEEGLEQEFNSLDAQREACEAFIASQRHEGWILLRDRYDDGGFSGGTMGRPALQRLLTDIAASRIDVVVVYKVDRLTRALGDFARIVELFDRHNVSFVSVTQAFNTTTSMGRLTLNVLLSFAQFEREVTGERIRDKIAASKKKGMWMGGQPSLGYDVHDRKLIINEAEAKTVRMIFRRYVALKSVRDLKAELDAAGIVSKSRTAADGSPYGSQRFSRGALYAMLQNRVYRGKITHKGAYYPGEHQAIVEEALFEEVQSTLAENRSERVSPHGQDPSPLTGLLFDADGERLTPSHALKKGVRYRYYVSRHLITGDKTERRGMRLPAFGIEALIRTRIGALLANPEELISILSAECDRAAIVSSAIPKAKNFDSLSAVDLGLALRSFVSRISVLSDRVAITIQPDALAAWILGAPVADRDDDQKSTIITAPIKMQQRGQEMRLVFGAEDALPFGHNGLIRLLARAHTIRHRLFEERLTIGEVAQAENLIPSYVTRLVRLTFLAPDITASILSGRHDPDLTVSRLIADTRFPLDWNDQRRSFATA